MSKAKGVIYIFVLSCLVYQILSLTCLALFCALFLHSLSPKDVFSAVDYVLLFIELLCNFLNRNIFIFFKQLQPKLMIIFWKNHVQYIEVQEKKISTCFMPYLPVCPERGYFTTFWRILTAIGKLLFVLTFSHANHFLIKKFSVTSENISMKDLKLCILNM